MAKAKATVLIWYQNIKEDITTAVEVFFRLKTKGKHTHKQLLRENITIYVKLKARNGCKVVNVIVKTYYLET